MNTYFIQRVIVNTKQWQQPTPGRLGRFGEGKYVKANGFGHEDWNFNKSFEIDGNIYGYAYYTPSLDKQNNKFNIAFAVYEDGNWYLVGFYNNVSYALKGTPDNKRILLAKARHLLELGDSLGRPWSGLSINEIADKVQKENKWIRWKVNPSNIKALSFPIKIPAKLFKIKNKRIKSPTLITESIFDRLIKLSLRARRVKENKDEEVSFPEGKKVQVSHMARERSQKAVALAKKLYLRKHGKYACQVCDFDFVEKYGQVGTDFIEAHHTIPVSELKPGHKTSPKEIALVCSNCHSMLHRRRPWLKMDELKKIIAI